MMMHEGHVTVMCSTWPDSVVLYRSVSEMAKRSGGGSGKDRRGN